MIRKITYSDKTEWTVFSDASAFLNRCYLLRNAQCVHDRIKLKSFLKLQEMPPSEPVFVRAEYRRVFEKPHPAYMPIETMRNLIADKLTFQKFMGGAQADRDTINRVSERMRLLSNRIYTQTQTEDMNMATKKVAKTAKTPKTTEPKAEKHPSTHGLRYKAMELVRKFNGSKTDKEIMAELQKEFPNASSGTVSLTATRRRLAEGYGNYFEPIVVEKKEAAPIAAEKKPVKPAKAVAAKPAAKQVKPIKPIKRIPKVEKAII